MTSKPIRMTKAQHAAILSAQLEATDYENIAEKMESEAREFRLKARVIRGRASEILMSLIDASYGDT